MSIINSPQELKNKYIGDVKRLKPKKVTRGRQEDIPLEFFDHFKFKLIMYLQENTREVQMIACEAVLGGQHRVENKKGTGLCRAILVQVNLDKLNRRFNGKKKSQINDVMTIMVNKGWAKLVLRGERGRPSIYALGYISEYPKRNKDGTWSAWYRRNFWFSPWRDGKELIGVSTRRVRKNAK